MAMIAAAVVAVLAFGAWGAWRAVESASRLEKLSDVAGQVFRAMHNLRLDRSMTVRSLDAEGAPTPAQVKQALASRAIELPALEATVALLRTLDIPNRDASVGALAQATASLAAMAKESAADFDKPKAERHAGLAQQYETTATGLLTSLDALSEDIVAAAKYGDPFVDHMMTMRDAVWAARYNGGETALFVSNAIMAKQKLTDAQLQKYATLVVHTEAAWEMVEKLRHGIALPPALGAAVDKAKASYFDPQFTAMRGQVIAAIAAGAPSPLAVPDWTAQSVPRLATITDLAEAALDAAKQHAGELVGAARMSLFVEIGMLMGALVCCGLGFSLVSGRVIQPLHLIQVSMMKVANGDLAVEVPYSDREDEIGKLAHALTTFKRNAGEKAQIEADQRNRAAQATTRQQAVEAHIVAFEDLVGEALQALSTASGDMRKTSEKLSTSAEATNRQAQDAAGAASNATTNVETVASSSQELSASIGEISRQVAHAASIAGRAVRETEETDATVRSLTEAAQRIGQIVSLINEIAEQTNLLALNATIEAARAGVSGKGFAVVAAEVKSLANQTAKATGDISGQVGAIREVAEKAVEAMRRIGGTIGEVNSVATSIATAVEQQGAATQEITRNTQEAARRTGEVAQNITGVTAGADATGQAAADVRTSAEALSHQADKLRHEVDGFLAKIRAA
jgi:methyl-accepting chemotaxis protein